MTKQIKHDLITRFEELTKEIPMLESGQRTVEGLEQDMKKRDPKLIFSGSLSSTSLSENKVYLPKSFKEEIKLPVTEWTIFANTLARKDEPNSLDLKKRVELAGSLQKDIAKQYKKYLKEHTIIKAILELISSIDAVTFLTNIFCNEFSEQLLNLQRSDNEPKDISPYMQFSQGIPHTQFCARLGGILSTVVFQKLFKKSETLLYTKKIKIPKASIPLILDLTNENYFLSNTKLKLTKKHIALFKHHFPKKWKKFFLPKDWRIFINLITLLILQRLLSYRKKDAAKNKNIAEFEIVLKTIQVDLKLKTKASVLLWVNQELEKRKIILGNELLQALNDNVIKIASTVGIKMNSQFHVTLINAEFIRDLPHTFPSVDTNIKVDKKTKLKNQSEFGFKRGEYSTIQSNYYMSGTMSKKVKEVYDLNKNANKFSINHQFLIPFLDTLIDYLKNWREYTSEKGKKTPFYSYCLDFIGELFEINFHELMSNASGSPDLQLIITRLFEYAVDFKNYKPFKFADAEFKKLKPTIAEYYSFYKSMKNKIYSRKIFISQILSTLFVMAHFDFFVYEWFLDARGRKYMYSNLSLQSIPLVKAAIGFYNATNIDEFVTDHYKYPNIKEEFKSSTKFKDFVCKEATKSFEDALKALMSKEDPLSMSNMINFYNVSSFCKVSKRFLFLARKFDYETFLKDKPSHRFITPLGQDATTSGLQQGSMFLNSKPLAQHATLCKKDKKDAKNSDGHLVALITIDKIIKTLCALGNRTDLTVEVIKNKINELTLPNTAEYRFEDLNDAEIIEKLKEYSKIFEPEILKLLLVRPNLKVLSMLLPYNLTAHGAVKQLLDKVMESAIINGIWISEETINKINRASDYIYPLYIKWYEDELPDGLLLSKAINRFCKKRLGWNTFTINTKHIKTKLHPHPMDSIRYMLSTSNKKARIRVSIIKNEVDKIDFRKLKNMFPPCICHSMDADAAMQVNFNVFEYNKKFKHIMHFYINHDCFATTALFGNNMWNFVAKAYKSVYKLNLLQSYKKESKFYEYIINNRQKGALLTEKDIASDTKFIKY